MPVVRVQVHVDDLVENQKLQELAEKAQEIVDRNRGTIQHWCNARRQEYSLNTSQADKKTYQLDRLTLTHTILFDQEIIELDVYPVAEQEKEEDMLCLMVLANGKIYAIPMSQLNTPTEMGFIYQKILNSGDLGSGVFYHRQYKFAGADIGFFFSDFNFSVNDVGEAAGGGLHLTPIDDVVEYSEPITTIGYLTAINGSGQTVYLPSGKYEYSKNSVVQTESFNFDVFPYAFDSSGTAYFAEGIQNLYGGMANNLNFSVGNGLTASMQSQRQQYITSNITKFIYPEPGTTDPDRDYCSNETRRVAIATSGTFPDGTLTVKGAFENGFPAFAAPLTDLSMTFFFPVFSTGNGDIIELQPYPVSASAQTDWGYLTGENYPGDLERTYAAFPELRNSIPCPNLGWGAYTGPGETNYSWAMIVTTSRVSFSFDQVNVVQIDEIRAQQGNPAGPPPQLNVLTVANFPTLGGPMYAYNHATTRGATGLPNTQYPESYEIRGTDTEGGGFVWSLLPDKANVIPDYTVSPLMHISNGVHYIQAIQTSTYVYPPTITRYVFCNGVDIGQTLENLGISNWNLMAMDIPLSRIKKFT